MATVQRTPMQNIIPIVIAATFHLDAGTLRVRYTIENKGEITVYLVNHLTRYEDKKGWIPDASVAYVFVSPLAEIEVCKRVPPVPDRLVTPRSYYVTPLGPKQKMEEELSFELPLVEHRPYDSFIGSLPAPKKIRARIHFSLGYFVSHELLKAEPVTVNEIHTFRLARVPPPRTTNVNAGKEIVEQLVRSEPVEMEISVVTLPTKVSQ